MRRALALLLIAGILGAAGPAAAQSPIVAQFWYSFGGTNREVTEAHIKRFNDSQSKYRIEGTFQGDYFEALAKIRAGWRCPSSARRPSSITTPTCWRPRV